MMGQMSELRRQRDEAGKCCDHHREWSNKMLEWIEREAAEHEDAKLVEQEMREQRAREYVEEEFPEAFWDFMESFSGSDVRWKEIERALRQAFPGIIEEMIEHYAGTDIGDEDYP